MFEFEHGRKDMRLRGYDYSQAGAYFVTLCLERRQCLLGSVVDAEMRLSALGQMIEQVWADLPHHYAHVELDQFILLPNHLHGIVFLTGDSTGGRPRRAVDLPKLITGFKIFTTREHRKGSVIGRWQGIEGKLWQKSYFDRVIRNDRELKALREYIANNPLRWHLDRENPEYQGQAGP
jgi:REP element-mobilizing transposase RayT